MVNLCDIKRWTARISILFLLLPNSANATHHLFLVTGDGKTVYVASDTERSVRNPDNSEQLLETSACKVIATQREVLVISGQASHTVAIKQEDGGFVFKTDREFRPIAARILNKNESTDQKVTDLLNEAYEHLKTMMVLKPEAAKFDLDTFNIRVTMVVFDQNGPRIWDFVIPVFKWEKGPENPIFYARALPIPAGHFYKVNVDDKYLPPPHSTARVGSEVKILTDALSKINSSQDTVVRLNESGSVIVLNKQFCPAPPSSDTSLTNP